MLESLGANMGDPRIRALNSMPKQGPKMAPKQGHFTGPFMGAFMGTLMGNRSGRALGGISAIFGNMGS